VEKERLYDSYLNLGPNLRDRLTKEYTLDNLKKSEDSSYGNRRIILRRYSLKVMNLGR